VRCAHHHPSCSPHPRAQAHPHSCPPSLVTARVVFSSEFCSSLNAAPVEQCPITRSVLSCGTWRGGAERWLRAAHLTVHLQEGNLEYFPHQEISVGQDAILAYLSDGTRLRSVLLRWSQAKATWICHIRSSCGDRGSSTPRMLACKAPNFSTGSLGSASVSGLGLGLGSAADWESVEIFRESVHRGAAQVLGQVAFA
jgi:hypothetical protein